MQSYL